MGNFKEKNIKYSTFCNDVLKKSLIVHGTLDSKHNEIMQDFDKSRKNLIKLRNKLEKLENRLKKIENKKSNNNDNENNIVNNNIIILELKDDINKLEEQIKKIESYDDELNYFLETSDILFKYYDNNKDINNEENNKKKIITSFEDFFNQEKNKNKDQKNNLFDKYMKITSNIDIKKKNKFIKICTKCNIEKILHLQDGFLICTNCGDSEYIIIDSDKPNYKNPIIENKLNGYKRMNHFSELLNQFQGKESTEISNNVFESIINELKVLKIDDLSVLNSNIMKTILKNLNLNNYYEHIPYIINKLNGIPPPTISRELDEKIRAMFKQVQEAWLIFKGSKRKNFLNNCFVLHKIFELLEKDEFIHFFPYLKSREKLGEHDDEWKQICNYNKWQFIPSL
jgi:hypothetical protein